ncbi:MAG: transcriptional activator RfaH [Rhodobacteraceae bacterium]|nr:transcriptional activator RfaH [Paracoccaceae bacterium]
MVRWHLAQIRPNSFQVAERNLRRQGFSVFAPTLAQTARRRGRPVAEQRPLFPGYLFVGFDPDTAPFRAINGTYGVSRLVSFGEGAPAEVPQPIVMGLMARCDAGARLIPPKVLQPGTEVQLIGGPFADFVATVESMAPDQRVWVLLECMGQRARVAVKVEALRER